MPLAICTINMICATFVYQVNGAVRHKTTRIMFPGRMLAEKCDELWTEKVNLTFLKGGQAPFRRCHRRDNIALLIAGRLAHGGSMKI